MFHGCSRENGLGQISIGSSAEHWHAQSPLPNYPLCRAVSSISVTDYSYARVDGQNTSWLLRRLRRSVGYEAHSRMDAVAHTDSSSLMHADPCCPGRRVEKRVQDRPVGYRITAV